MNQLINNLVLESNKYAVVIAVLFIIFICISIMLLYITKKINQN